MAIDRENISQQADEERKHETAYRTFVRHKIIIYEEKALGTMRRIVDPRELGIIESHEQTVQIKPTPNSKKYPSRAEKTDPVRPKIYPTIYEESFGGIHRRVVTIDELSARLK